MAQAVDLWSFVAAFAVLGAAGSFGCLDDPEDEPVTQGHELFQREFPALVSLFICGHICHQAVPAGPRYELGDSFFHYR